jgi:hypothetical protein
MAASRILLSSIENKEETRMTYPDGKPGYQNTDEPPKPATDQPPKTPQEFPNRRGDDPDSRPPERA